MANDALKAELSARLSRSRTQIARQLDNLKDDMDVPSHIKQSFTAHRIPWIGAATLLGWGLSRLRKNSQVITKETIVEEPLKNLALLPGVAKLLFQAARPALTAFATQKIAEIAANRR